MSATENETFTLPSFAKINLHLRILGKRDDGFHELCTIFQTVSLKDDLSFRPNRKLILTCGDKKNPTDERNLIARAAVKLREKYKIETGAAIHLEKIIPSPGGLGGGSSNAAVALIGLARLWKIEFNSAEFDEIGKQLGADVPFFFRGGTALGTGRGDEILRLNDWAIDGKRLLVVTPNVSVATPAAFARLNAARLTNISSKSILQICRCTAQTLDLELSNAANDFENSVFQIEPEIRRVKEKFISCGASRAFLSGSGASVFAVFGDEESLEKAAALLNKEKSWRVYKVNTISNREYRVALNLEDDFDGRKL
ncbi:MAG: 4-(cytidine 5'-diphospho)-2-C-methyl-D-erythritol kinase [Acidobacteria bacterium]|nr:4-(cytidine 5'-diphospho)-2-C-methyl-D-erythritol kinase [Acidobacteriota bacterium]